MPSEPRPLLAEGKGTRRACRSKKLSAFARFTPDLCNGGGGMWASGTCWTAELSLGRGSGGDAPCRLGLFLTVGRSQTIKQGGVGHSRPSCPS